MTSFNKNNDLPKEPLILNCLKPEYLKAGDTIALISPSYHVSREYVEKGAEVLRSWGFATLIGPNVGKIHDVKYAGTIEERLSDFRWALGKPEVKAIICNRGGLGSIQLIDLLKYDEFAANPKWMVGFSDISTFHGLMTRAGVMSIHGTMIKSLAEGGQDGTCVLMRNLLLGQVPHYELPPHPQNIEGKANGTLVGGNLCTVAPNIGSQADALAGHDLILFLEEVKEPMHNVDRQFNILRMNGVLDRCKGVVLGEFINCGTEGSCGTIEAMLHHYFEEQGIPVICGFPAGHGEVNLPLVMGAPVTMEVRTDGATLQFDIEGEQHTISIENPNPKKEE